MKDIELHLPRLRRYARALTGDRHASEDLVQDTVERALLRFAWFRTGAKLDAWLLAIMHNLFISQKRHRAAQPDTEPIDERSAEVTVCGTEQEALALRDLDRALARLPDEQRSVLLLISLEEFSYEEAARILGLPVGTVMSRLSRARERLRAILSENAASACAGASSTHLKVVK
jgi:RNA polymerase sigma-70 factor (ECF subfamily)